ncbi:alpha-2-macroglobulin family protein, partial [Undibacterium squillarum]|uniref:alpha-2-macroglobulin family protein n=1 Tax=Undibacterium squillarum TaxID=1131567 RepID=UPI0040407E41
KETGSASHASDSLKFSQKRVTAVPVTVQQATLVQIDKTLSMNLIRPQDALPDRGGIALNYSASLLNGSEGLRRYFERYPYSCLEQRTSKAIGLRDKQMWQKVVNDLPSYLDENGLAFYFPLQSGAQQGSDALTAYLLAITQEGGYPIPDEFRKKMLQGLSDFVEGKITRKYWSPSADLDFRKLSALEALSRYQAVQPRMLGSISVTPNLWPTSAVLDWYAILSRSTAIPKRDQLLKEADQILRARLSYQGTKMIFNTEQNDNLWWLMSNSNSNAVRLLLTMADKPEWKEDMPRLLNGALQRQNSGHWGTTTANAWGTLALEKFARTFETEKVSGVTTAALPAMDKPLAFSWTANEGKVMLPAAQLRAGEQVLQLNHEGKGKPWVTLQSLAAIPLKNPNFSGLRLTRKIIPVEQKTPGQYSKGDVLRIDVQIETNAELVWVVLNDPVPAGASIMGSGLGRDSAIAANQVSDNKDAPVYEERSFDAYRAYYQWLPKGKITASYVIRLNQPGDFRLPSTRAEVMYSPEIFAELPNASMSVK